MRRVRPTAWLTVAMTLLLGFGSFGCAALGSPSRPAPAPPVMDQARMELVFAEQVEAIEGPSGALRTIHDDVEVYLISDPANDRMQLIARIAQADQVDPRVFNILLQANFFLTLDARYAVSDGIIFAAYLHPISSLSEEELVSGLEQVIALVKNFGTTFSSGKIEFGVSP